MDSFLKYGHSYWNLLESKSKVDVVYIDFKKAFVSVTHDHLLNKL